MAVQFIQGDTQFAADLLDHTPGVKGHLRLLMKGDSPIVQGQRYVDSRGTIWVTASVSDLVAMVNPPPPIPHLSVYMQSETPSEDFNWKNDQLKLVEQT